MYTRFLHWGRLFLGHQRFVPDPTVYITFKTSVFVSLALSPSLMCISTFRRFERLSQAIAWAWRYVHAITIIQMCPQKFFESGLHAIQRYRPKLAIIFWYFIYFVCLFFFYPLSTFLSANPFLSFFIDPVYL